MKRVSLPYLYSDEDQLCFLHIGKNGGSTLLNILDNLVGLDGVCTARHMEEIAQLSQEEIARYRLFRGHFWYNVHELIGRKPIYFTVFRHPIERARSTYEHIHRHPHGRHHIVKKLSFEEYIHSDTTVSLDVNNWQTRVITACIDPSEEPDLELAKKRVAEFAFVGLTERYRESMLLLSYTFSWPPIVDYPVLNVTEDSIKGKPLSESAAEKLREINAKDLELYNWCETIFRDRLELMRNDQSYRTRLLNAGIDPGEV